MWNWSFGDNSSSWFNTTNSASRNASHTYTSADRYSVSLTVTNTTGNDTATRTNYITVFASSGGSETPPLLSLPTTPTSAPIISSSANGNGSGEQSAPQASPPIQQVLVSTPPPTLVSATVPSANFTANKKFGLVPLTVHFVDTSTGYPTSWEWDFGDHNTSVLQNPVYTYVNSGNYTVSLTVKNSEGNNTLIRTNYIWVRSANAQFIRAKYFPRPVLHHQLRQNHHRIIPPSILHHLHINR
jgi:PKD repeat protein